MRLDSQTEAGRPHIEVERMVSDALCEVNGLETDPPDNPQSVIDRIFYHSLDKVLAKDGSAQQKAHELVHRTPSSVAEIKHRNKGWKGDVRSFLPGGSLYDSGYMIDTAKIDNGIRISAHLRVPFFVIVALDGPAEQPQGDVEQLEMFTTPPKDQPIVDQIVAWQITEKTQDGTMTMKFTRLSGERETQATVNGGRKKALVDYLPCDEMLMLEDVTIAYRRMRG